MGDVRASGGFARYESPCGVMRMMPWYFSAPIAALRIPMRGYEALELKLIEVEKVVTNPHAGL